MLTLDAAATADALPFERLIPALRALFAQGCEVPPRQVLQVGTEAAPITSLVMPAWLPGRAYGVKVVNVAAGNRERGLPGVHASYMLFDGATGAPSALLDGSTLTNRRTAAASALAASYLARPDARRMLLVGAGQIASLLPAAYRTQRAIEHVDIWARRHEQAQWLATQLHREGFSARATTELDAAVAQADIVSCATLATVPLVRGALLRPGSHLDLIGSFTPAMREADDACLLSASVFIDTDEALAKSGDLLGPMQRGLFGAGAVCARLADLSRGHHPGRRDGGERTVFKSVGTALEDLAAAMLATRLA
jgi:ornithine cyclodeaminase/alanine dehydrogenase-like protein (mu-crystallin family)